MKTTLTILFFIIFHIGYAQKADDILGTWRTDDNKGKVKVYKKGGQYYGEIIWLNDKVSPNGKKPLLDINNPKPEKRNRPLVGINLLQGLHWDADEEEWADGEIYDPESGNTYSVYAWMEEKGKLKIKGYLGISLLGRTTEWTKVN